MQHLSKNQYSLEPCCGGSYDSRSYFWFIWCVTCPECKEQERYKDLNTILEIGYDGNKQLYHKAVEAGEINV